MAAEIKLTAMLLLLCMASLTIAQDMCDYMMEIPRPDRPEDWDVGNFDGMTWSERPLIPADEDRLDLCMGSYFPGSNSGTQLIFMEEEIDDEIIIAKLNYQGASVPYIGTFLLGMRNVLGPEIRNVNGEWVLIIINRQDYETPEQRQYMFTIFIEGESFSVIVSIQIVNIDDNPPIIHIFDTCPVPELGEIGLTDCVYQVTDADGEISTRFIWFEIQSPRNDDEIFYIDGTPFNQLQPYTINMTVGLHSSLNFETNPLHIFTVIAHDSLPNNHSVTMMVQVENVEHRPPRWIDIFAVQQFDEKTYANFTVKAIDGDTGIDDPINYTLITDERDDFFRIVTLPGGYDGAVLYVDPIDRDELERDIFYLSIVAFKEHNFDLQTVAPVVIIVNDVNDQRPEPLHKEHTLHIMEETAMTLNFGENEFGFHDKDIGENARYSVRLESDNPPGAASAFQISPQEGYQRQTFILTTINHNMLDYEVPEFQEITLKVIATDLGNENLTGEITVNIHLINWNDEVPIFEYESQEVTFEETVGAGFLVGTAIAHDRDIDDRVVHSLMGNADRHFVIDEDTGEIRVAFDEAFDYHVQNELFIQIRAVDTLGDTHHTTTAQFVVHLIDINNTPPTLHLPRVTPNVEENVPEDFLITDDITATDPDTTAHLVFEIDWYSTYATKQGRLTPLIEYENCVRIETEYPTGNTGFAVGRVLVREIRENVTIDYEEFELLYLTVRVRDLATVDGVDFDELVFTIVIIDMNDNRPLWTADTEAAEFRVREVSASGTVIGNVLATDIDGPMYNQIRYLIEPKEGTPEGLVKIDKTTGQMTVDEDGAIDADEPPRDYLYYTVIATDQCDTEPEECPPDPTYWRTPIDIEISIIDTNNKIPEPQLDQFNTTVRIWENVTTGDDVVTIVSRDLDRDEIYHTVRYQINYAVNPSNLNFFAVDLDTGWVHINYTGEAVLDRDFGEPQHTIFLLLTDNFYAQGDGVRNVYTELIITVILLDVNDNAPVLPSPDTFSWSLSENTPQATEILPYLYAPDYDEPETDNSRVGYEIWSVDLTDRDIEVPTLFEMQLLENSPGNFSGQLVTTADLRGYWGSYDIHIYAYDHGQPPLDDEQIYRMVIRPYNYHAPEFVFPSHGSVLRLAKESALVASTLYTVNGEPLHLIYATDEDGLEAGIVTFTIEGDDEAQDYFQISYSGENTGSLVLTQLFPEEIREFQVTIRARDGGTEPGFQQTDSTITVVFLPTTSTPFFTTTTVEVAFIEKEAGMSESHSLPLAEDSKNYLCDDDCYDIYYRIVGGNEEGFFGLDPVNNILYLERELDRSEGETRVVVIAPTNSPAQDAIVPQSTLSVTVTVREADPRPIFVRDIYTAGISTIDAIGKELLTVQAIHTEGDRPIVYTIDHDTMVVDSSLEAVRNTAFVLNPQTGLLTLNMQPTASMHGMFEFSVLATDTEGASDDALVRVYLITDLNRVFFLFYNPLQLIEDETEFIAQTFSYGFNMTCNIDQVVPSSDANGIALDDRTEVRSHFIRDNQPVSADVIEQLRSDTQLLLAVQNVLNTRMLVLQDFVTGSSPAIGIDSIQNTVYVLAALSALLALLCLMLLVTFILRTRALNRRLEALSMTKYGSVDSGLNRVGLSAPGTNKHAVEGSNPIWNETIKAPDFDALSDTSGDSDLIGIEDMPQFRSDYFPPNDNDSTQEILGNEYHRRDSLPNHSNNFNFKMSPFLQHFTDGQFK